VSLRIFELLAAGTTQLATGKSRLSFDLVKQSHVPQMGKSFAAKNAPRARVRVCCAQTTSLRSAASTNARDHALARQVPRQNL